MPRKLSNALSHLQLNGLKPGRHADGAGLHLHVKPPQPEGHKNAKPGKAAKGARS